MEPKKSSAQSHPQPRAVTKKSPPRAADADADADADAVAAGVESPLSSLFHPTSHGANGKEQELYAILFKGQNGTAQASITGNGKSPWSHAKSRATYTKDNRNSHTYDSVDTSSCFGSSVHYGGRDYYGSFTPKQSTEYNDHKANKDPVTDSHGDWWQGSFNY